MNADGKALAGRTAPQDWLIEVHSAFCLHKPSGSAFSIGFLPEEFAEGFEGIRGFVALPALSRWGGTGSALVAQIGREAVQLYVALLRRQLRHEPPQLLDRTYREAKPR